MDFMSSASILDWVLAFAAFGLGLVIFFGIGMGNMAHPEPKLWVYPALSIPMWGSLTLLVAVTIQVPAIRLLLLLVLLVAEIVVVVGYTLHRRGPRRGEG